MSTQSKFNTHHPIKRGDANVHGITLHYQEEGYSGDPAMILIMGLGSQLTLWPQQLVDNLVNEGFRVIRFDNRDIGLSSVVNNGVQADLPNAMLRSRLRLPITSNYTLYDMVSDTAGLLDALGIEQAHIVGASMGGMIAQLFSALYSHRTLSLTSIMSTTNEPGLPLPRWDILMNLAGYGVKKGHDKATAVQRSLQFWKKISSPKYPTPEHDIQQRIASDYDRSYRPASYLRQSHAIIATGGFKRLLSRINCPTQIIHGTDDPLVHKKGGIASAKSIPGAKLELIKGMGHDFPQQLLPKLTELIAFNALTGNK
ncbi:MAG TPA: alpha/beta hydrolase [Gammaproteobacteria bacterium]|nr:alpha/beta hydrolase [Gammaproteobacteria bacterium]